VRGKPWGLSGRRINAGLEPAEEVAPRASRLPKMGQKCLAMGKKAGTREKGGLIYRWFQNGHKFAARDRPG